MLENGKTQAKKPFDETIISHHAPVCELGYEMGYFLFTSIFIFLFIEIMCLVKLINGGNDTK